MLLSIILLRPLDNEIFCGLRMTWMEKVLAAGLPPNHAGQYLSNIDTKLKVSVSYISVIPVDVLGISKRPRWRRTESCWSDMVVSIVSIHYGQHLVPHTCLS